MIETCSIEIEMPEFMRLVDAEVRKQIIEEVNNEIREHVTELFSNTARELIAQKLDLKPAGGTEKKRET